MLTITLYPSQPHAGAGLVGPQKMFDIFLKAQVSESEVIPCRGGPCGRPQPFLGKVIFWLRKYTSET